jgi:hypothetical protein
MPSWCRQVNWGNCGFPWVNCAVLWVEDDWKGSFWGLRYCLSKLHSLLSFPSGMTSQSKIAHFNWEWTGRFTNKLYAPLLQLIRVRLLSTHCLNHSAHHIQPILLLRVRRLPIPFRIFHEGHKEQRRKKSNCFSLLLLSLALQPSTGHGLVSRGF